MTSPRVLNLASVTTCPDVLDPLRAFAEVVTCPHDRDQVRATLVDCDACLVNFGLTFDHDLLAPAARLQALASPSAGLDHVDLAACAALGVRVVSLADAPEVKEQLSATAELAWALLLACFRHLPRALAAGREGVWGDRSLRGRQVRGKTLGVVGYGRLGRQMAGYGTAFGMRVLACNRSPRVAAAGVTLTDLETVLAESDVVSVHVPLTAATTHLIDAAALARMKPGAVLINTSRGAVVDEAALLAALGSGHLAAAGVDVISDESGPDLADHPMVRYAREHEHLLLTPHVGGFTFESQRLALEAVVGVLVDLLAPGSA